MATLDLNNVDTSGPTGLVGLSRSDLANEFAEGFSLDPKKARMRANQCWRWLYGAGATEFSEMTDIGKEMRGQMAERYSLSRCLLYTSPSPRDS